MAGLVFYGLSSLLKPTAALWWPVTVRWR